MLMGDVSRTPSFKYFLAARQTREETSQSGQTELLNPHCSYCCLSHFPHLTHMCDGVYTPILSNIIGDGHQPNCRGLYLYIHKDFLFRVRCFWRLLTMAQMQFDVIVGKLPKYHHSEKSTKIHSNSKSLIFTHKNTDCPLPY